MKHLMRLHPRPFLRIKEGNQIIETRVNDEKRQKMQIGDSIEFTNRENPEETVLTKVLSLERHDSFSDLFDSFPVENFGGKDKESLMGIYQYYSKENEAKYGVVGIRLELIKDR